MYEAFYKRPQHDKHFCDSISGISVREVTRIVSQINRPAFSQHRPEVFVERPTSEERSPEVVVIVLLHLRRPPRLPRSRDRTLDDDRSLRHRIRHHSQLRADETLPRSGEMF